MKINTNIAGYIDSKKEEEVYISPAFSEKNIAVAVASSDLYSPYLSVLIQSIVSFSSDYNYDIIVLNKDISDKNKKIIRSHFAQYSNFSIRFIDVNKYIEGRILHTQGLAIETYFRFFLLDIMCNYDKTIYLDCDMVVNTDIADLYNIDLGDCYIGATRDANLITCYYVGTKWTSYLDERLNVKNPADYFQAGTLLINLKNFRRNYTVEMCMDICSSYEWWLFDQDVFNMICQEHKIILDMRWNVMSGEEGRLEHIRNNSTYELREEYFAAREYPFIVHYCGKKKPWDYLESDFAELFWKQAKMCPYYEVILSRHIQNTSIVHIENDINKFKRFMVNVRKAFKSAPQSRKLSVNAVLLQENSEVKRPVNIKANAEGVIGNVLYEFGVKLPSDKVFRVIHNFADTDKVTYIPEKTGVYTFSIKAKDEFGAEGLKILKVNVTKSSVPEVRLRPVLPEATRKLVLFRCCTVFQLLNAVNLKNTVLKNVRADIILSKATDFTNFIPALKRLRIFRKIIISNDTPETYFEWRRQNEQFKIDLMLYPEEYIGLDELKDNYTDLYIAVADDYNKVFYYYLIKYGMRPNIHIFEDGLSTYLIDFMQECLDDILNHEIYGDLSFCNNISELLLYQPDLHIESTFKCPVNSIPRISCDNKNVKLFNSIFGKNMLPKEKYIFLEEAFVWDGISSTDTDLINDIADIVGKENIIIKLHPRNGIDRFSKEGYKLVENSKIPWEMTIMNSDLKDKVFITVSSTSAFTAGMVFGKKFRCINLFDLMLLGKNVHVRNPKFSLFYEKLLEKYNNESNQIFHPVTINELRQELIYLESGSEIDE